MDAIDCRQCLWFNNDVKTHSPLFYMHVVLESRAKLGLPKEHAERGIYIAKGSIEVNGRNVSMQDR